MKWLKRGVMGWLAYRLLTRETPPNFGPGQRHPLRVPGRTVFVGDQEVFVREMGDPDLPPLVLIHGWGDHSLVVFSKLIPLLAKRFRILAFDSRNNGKTDVTRGDYQISDIADDIAGALDQLGVSSVAVFGYSMGGMVAQTLAQRHPHKVTKLILSGTASVPPGAQQPLRSLALVGATLARAFDRVSRSEVSYVRTRYLLRVGAIDQTQASWFYTQHRNRDPDLYWAAARAINQFDSGEWIGRIGVPTLVIIMCNDQLMPAVCQYDLVSRLSSPEVVEIAGARHEGPLTHPERFSKAIFEFLGV